jgi:hypothetical protein
MVIRLISHSILKTEKPIFQAKLPHGDFKLKYWEPGIRVGPNLIKTKEMLNIQIY